MVAVLASLSIAVPQVDGGRSHFLGSDTGPAETPAGVVTFSGQWRSLAAVSGMVRTLTARSLDRGRSTSREGIVVWDRWDAGRGVAAAWCLYACLSSAGCPQVRGRFLAMLSRYAARAARKVV
jgi:hypothetical protein